MVHGDAQLNFTDAEATWRRREVPRQSIATRALAPRRRRLGPFSWTFLTLVAVIILGQLLPKSHDPGIARAAARTAEEAPAPREVVNRGPVITMGNRVPTGWAWRIVRGSQPIPIRSLPTMEPYSHLSRMAEPGSALLTTVVPVSDVDRWLQVVSQDGTWWGYARESDLTPPPGIFPPDAGWREKKVVSPDADLFATLAGVGVTGHITVGESLLCRQVSPTSYFVVALSGSSWGFLLNAHEAPANPADPAQSPSPQSSADENSSGSSSAALAGVSERNDQDLNEAPKEACAKALIRPGDACEEMEEITPIWSPLGGPKGNGHETIPDEPTPGRR
jgi:hypothetical protein